MDYDVLVIGAGFGGLACALGLAEGGARVLLCEALNYPGGCASTFTRDGFQFEAGATLFSGFAEGQLFQDWIQRYGLDVSVRFLDPVVKLRTPGWHLEVPDRRETLIQRFCEMPNAPAQDIRDFFQRQQAVADTLWDLFDQPELLPPFGLPELFRHLRTAPRYLKLLGLLGKPLQSLLRQHRLQDFEPLLTYLNAVCQITVQASAAEAEAPFALAAMDYYFRGTGHVHGGIGKLAWELVRAIRQQGGDVRLPQRVKHLERTAQGWSVELREGRVQARTVVANLLPQAVRTLCGLAEGQRPRLDRLATQVEGGWGAAMLYWVVRDEGLPEAPFHLELIQDPAQSFTEGNHLFCSVSGRDESHRAGLGQRTVTVSTHVPAPEFHRLSAEAQALKMSTIQQRMRQGLQRLAPELHDRKVHELTASPRTFERFTRRPGGLVGGIPRRAGLSNYTSLLQGPVLPDLHLVGDTVFPGQSTLATAIGGNKLASRLLKLLQRRSTWERLR